MCGGGATAAVAAVAKDFPEARLTSPAEEEAESLIVFSVAEVGVSWRPSHQAELHDGPALLMNEIKAP